MDWIMCIQHVALKLIACFLQRNVNDIPHYTVDIHTSVLDHAQNTESDSSA